MWCFSSEAAGITNSATLHWLLSKPVNPKASLASCCFQIFSVLSPFPVTHTHCTLFLSPYGLHHKLDVFHFSLNHFHYTWPLRKQSLHSTIWKCPPLSLTFADIPTRLCSPFVLWITLPRPELSVYIGVYRTFQGLDIKFEMQFSQPSVSMGSASADSTRHG